VALWYGDCPSTEVMEIAQECWGYGVMGFICGMFGVQVGPEVGSGLL